MALTVVKPSGIDTTGNYTVNGMIVSANANVSNISANGTVNFTSASNVSLGAVGNIKITGGTANYVLQTDGAGNLSWAAQTGGGGNTSSISNGNSNVSIPTANGNVNISAEGNANIVVVTGTGVSLTGNILPTTTNTYSLGSPTYNFKDVYIGPGSLYVNGQKVLEQDSNTIVVTANINQNLRLETTGTGAIEFLPGSTSVIAVKGTLQVDAGKSITSSDGDKIRFGDTIAVDSITTASANTELVITGNGSGNVKVDDDLIITGNLTLQGSTSNLSVANLVVQDNIIDISAETTGTPTANAGIRVIRGDEPATQLKWVESTTSWQYTNDGTNYLTIVGKDSAGNINLGNAAIANYFVGNFYGTANSATTAGTVTTNAQPNITSVGLLTALSVGPNSGITLTGTSGYVRANSIQGTDGVAAIYPAYNGVTGAAGITTNLTVGIGAAGNVTANGNVTASYFIGNGSSLSSITGGNVTGQVANALIAGTVYTNAQPNITSIGTLTGLTSNGTVNFTNASNVSLGAVGNVKVTGGTSGQYLQTDGAGNLSWATVSSGSTSNISNGTSNVSIATSGGNVTTSVGGNANIVIVTGTGVNVAGTLNATGNANVGNIGATNGVFTNVSGNGSALSSLTGGNVTGQVANALIAGTVYTAAQPNITSVGTLTGLTSNGTVNFTNASNVSLGAVGNLKITGGTANYVLQTDGAGNLSWVAQSGSGGTSAPQPGTAFDTSITVANNYAVTATMANAAVFGSNAIVYSMYVTNIDSTGANGASISANFRYANGTTLSIANQIPVPYRGAVELLKQPKYFASGDAIQFQGLNNGTGASSFFHASITYETTTDATYQYSVTNIASSNTATNVYTSTSNASVVQSVMLTNSSNLGNIPVTVTISNSSNVVEAYLSSTLLLPVNSTVELCENPRNMASGSVIQVTAGGANTVTVTVAAKKI